MQARLEQQIEFIHEIDRLKTVLRRTVLTDNSRHENSAEHSWHLAVMALLLAEYANQPVDLLRVLKMVLVHDLVEIDAGDTFCYDSEANRDREEREQRAADRIFALLPSDQEAEMRSLWEEFEARQTDDARFAAALDRMQPMLTNLRTAGHSWRKHGIVKEQIVARNSPIADGSRQLWERMSALLDQAVADGLLNQGEAD
jgi:putative hydrolase of HD superfamily